MSHAFTCIRLEMGDTGTNPQVAIYVGKLPFSFNEIAHINSIDL